MMSYVAYYGHVQNTSHLGDSITTSHLLGALVEVPCWVVPIIINKAGRRSPLITFFLLATVFSLGYYKIIWKQYIIVTSMNGISMEKH